MRRLLLLLIISTLLACNKGWRVAWPARTSSLGGTAFYQQASPMKWAARDSFVLQELLNGNVPSFLERFVPVHVSFTDSIKGTRHRATYYVSQDYLSVGTSTDWARINITPYAAQRIADTLQCFLPTRKIVDDIYRSAVVKLDPSPMYAFRDSTPTMWQHHLIIEGQRKGRKGLIAGIKKDVVISPKINQDPRPQRVAIYGWHKSDGLPIQPLYTGHIYWWVDYSQGIRLVYRKIKVDGKWMDYKDILVDPVLSKLICDEKRCDFFRYPLQ